MPSATERCGCGADIVVTSHWDSDIKNRLQEWRAGHRRSEPTPSKPINPATGEPYLLLTFPPSPIQEGDNK